MYQLRAKCIFQIADALAEYGFCSIGTSSRLSDAANFGDLQKGVDVLQIVPHFLELTNGPYSGKATIGFDLCGTETTKPRFRHDVGSWPVSTDHRAAFHVCIWVMNGPPQRSSLQ